MALLRLCASVVMLLTFVGCNSDPPVTPDDFVYAPPPTITGFVVTNSHGEECGQYGIPNDRQGSEETFRISLPYPNPTNSSTLLYLRNVDTVTVSVWAVRGLGPGGAEADPGVGQSIGAPVVVPIKPIVIVNDQVLPPGIHSVVWDILEGDRPYIPGGFYRIYCQADTQLYWVDLYYLTSDNEQMFQELRDLLGHCLGSIGEDSDFYKGRTICDTRHTQYCFDACWA